jgi:maleate isomerase
MGANVMNDVMIKRTSSKEKLAIRFDQGRHHRAKIGYVLLAMEQTIEEDIYRLTPPGVGVHFTRAGMANSVTVGTLQAMKKNIRDAAALLLPDGDLDVICYACTSGSVVIGEDEVRSELLRGASRAKPTTLVSGVIRALRELRARRIAVGTAYVDEINVIEAEYLRKVGFDVLDIQGLNIEHDNDMVRVTPEYLYQFAKSLDHPDADALFISCGALRTLDIVEALEQELRKPVVVSNQAMIWDTFRLAGIQDKIPGYGRLLRDH